MGHTFTKWQVHMECTQGDRGGGKECCSAYHGTCYRGGSEQVARDGSREQTVARGRGTAARAFSLARSPQPPKPAHSYHTAATRFSSAELLSFVSKLNCDTDL